MAKTMKVPGRNVFFVEVKPNVAKKVLSVDDELAQAGVRVQKAKVAYKAVRVLDAIKTAWLAYRILKEAKNKLASYQRDSCECRPIEW